MGRLDGKVVLITGAAHGIGRATLELFAREGARLVACDLEEDPLREAASATGALPVVMDVADPPSVEEGFARALEAFGRLDGVVHYAGITRDNFHWKMPLEDWERVIRVNLTGSFLVARAASEAMRERNPGSIVLTSSRVYLGNLGQANYSASKAGVVGLTRTLALELGRWGIRVNALAPGFIETRMTAQVPEKVREKAIAATPLGRAGKPLEVAYAALFLVSDESSFITGQVLFVDGGRTIGAAPG
ncbi:SDR family oxidoreductase [Thermus filiformis]|uniref:3-oxoacyl-ACP reductase n=1 Tax=Thermus filiformis TaxID=276 RepID=A0A0A2WN68_THEFI|nr:SDR family oxidoreductase [Thermus filiformis]KGQ21258.1 3-oxoacyl-ACP reductase [Thermus filiformis]